MELEFGASLAQLLNIVNAFFGLVFHCRSFASLGFITVAFQTDPLAALGALALLDSMILLCTEYTVADTAESHALSLLETSNVPRSQQTLVYWRANFEVEIFQIVDCNSVE